MNIERRRELYAAVLVQARRGGRHGVALRDVRALQGVGERKALESVLDLEGVGLLRARRHGGENRYYGAPPSPEGDEALLERAVFLSETLRR